MAARLYHVLALLFWLAAMTWLVVEKVMPPLLGGNPPDYRSALIEPDEEPDCWKITWNGQSIGLVVTQIVDGAQGEREMRSVVQFEDLPLESMMSELLGAFASFATPLVGTAPDDKIQAVLATRLAFDEDRRMKEFSTVLDLAATPGLLTIVGRVTGGRKLAVVAKLAGGWGGSGTSGDQQELRHELDLPPDALVGDTFTPSMELKDLQVGQAWTIPVYRAFPPNSPVQIVEAKVERHDIIFWEGNDIETMLVVYRTDAGSGLRATSQAAAREWVRPDGTVLRQELAFAGLTLRFERQMRGPSGDNRALLDEEKHPRYWTDVLSTH